MVGSKGLWKALCLPLNFDVNLKLLQKNKVNNNKHLLPQGRRGGTQAQSLQEASQDGGKFWNVPALHLTNQSAVDGCPTSGRLLSVVPVKQAIIVMALTILVEAWVGSQVEALGAQRRSEPPCPGAQVCNVTYINHLTAPTHRHPTF